MQKTIITSRHNPFHFPWREIWEYRELLWMLAWRDFKVRYAQTFLGFTWAFINPILTLIILTFVFGTIAKVDTGGIPHAVYTLAGMCGWTFFASLTGDAGRSILAAQGMIKKIYFPRLVIPLSKVFTSLIDFGIVLLCLFALMLFYQVIPSSNMIWFPFFLLVAIMSGLAGGILISAMTIRFRDVQHIIPLIFRVGMYATPIAYPASAVPEKYQLLFFLNPMAGVVEGMRWSILGESTFPEYIWLSLTLVFFFLIFSLFYFNKVEKVIADIL